MTILSTTPVAGWIETASLPKLGVKSICVKLDTGAQTSSLHAFNVEIVSKNDQRYVAFQVHPFQDNDTELINCVAPLVDIRDIKSSNGHTEERCVVSSVVKIGSIEWPIEITLTNREQMNYRMLLGRAALQIPLLVAPHEKYLLSEEINQQGEKKCNFA